VRFTVLAAPQSDPGAARARASAVVAVDGAAAVAAAANACDDPYLLLLARGAVPHPSAFGGVTAALEAGVGVLGGATHAAGARQFGWMLAPAPCGPLPFALAPVGAPLGEAGADALVRGPIDVVAPGMLLAARELLLAPLPDEPVAALLELCARARDARRDVVCRPTFACDAPPLDDDDRGRAAALRALAERRPDVSGAHRLPYGARRIAIEREVRLEGGQRLRVRMPRPPVSVLVHGRGAELAARRASDRAANVSARAVDDAASALRAELRVRGDRYVVVADAAYVPDVSAIDTLIERLESAPFVAVAAPDAALLDGRCVALHAGRFPQHVVPAGATLADAMGSLLTAAHALRRAVRAPGYAPPANAAAASAQRRATIVFLSSSVPEVTRLTLDAVLAAARADDEVVAVCAASAATAQRILAAYPQVRVETDAADPLLTAGANRAIGAAARELVVLVADDVLVPAGALERMRDAFARIPALGAAFPAVPGAPGGEGVLDVSYADVAEMRVMAERRERARARESEPLDLAVTPVVAVTREAFAAVGGIDPAHGPTRQGIAGLVARLRTAGYAVVRCDDALVHRFDASFSRNPAAAAGLQQPVPQPPDRSALARGFDPVARVPFVSAHAPAVASAAASHAIAVPVGGAAELERAAAFLAAAATAFDAGSPVRVHVLLDGTCAAADVAARIRAILAASGTPMDATLAVRIERVDDLAAWRASLDPGVRVAIAAGHERDALADCTSVGARMLRELLEPVAR
jgi:hypothetical protein